MILEVKFNIFYRKFNIYLIFLKSWGGEKKVLIGWRRWKEWKQKVILNEKDICWQVNTAVHRLSLRPETLKCSEVNMLMSFNAHDL